MYRTFLVALVLLILPSLSVAQQSTVRPRIGSTPPVDTSQQAPTISIIQPTTGPEYTTPESVIDISGAVGTSADSVVWVSDRGPSGDATFADGLWSIVTAGAAVDVFDEDFSSASSANLTTHTVTPGPGSSWATANAGLGSNYCNIRSNGYVQPALTENSSLLMCRAVTASALSANYNVAFKLTTSMPTVSHPNRIWGVYFSAQQTTNPTDFCAVMVGSAGVTDLRLIQRVSGTGSVITAVDANPALNNIVSVEVRGAAIVVKLDGVEKINTSDADCNGASRYVGLIFGAALSEADNNTETGQKIDDFLLTDVGTGTSGIPLSAGDNVITVTACNSLLMAPNDCSEAVITVSTGADTTPPSISMTQPTGGTPYSTPGSTVTLSGITSDLVGVDTVICTNDEDMVSYPASIVSGVWTCADIALTLGLQNIEFEACDAASNCTAASVEVTRTAAADSTVPTIDIDVPSGDIGVSASSTTLSGTANDNASVASVSCTCDVCGGGGTASGSPGATMNWSLAVNGTLVVGPNIFSCKAVDSSNNESTVGTRTITYTPALSIVTPAALPAATEDVLYTEQTLTAQGGTGTYTWDNGASGTTLGGGNCTTGTITDSGNFGKVNGTFTTTAPVTCSFTARVCDTTPTCVQKTMTIAVISGTFGSQDHSYFESMKLRGDFVKAESMREPEKLCQLSAACPNGILQDPAYDVPGFLTYGTTYDPASDTNAQRQDFAKLQIPQFFPTKGFNGITVTLETAISTAPAAGTFEQITVSDSSAFETGSGVKIDNEIMVCMHPGSNLNCRVTIGHPGIIMVMRGAYGTTPATHTATTVVMRSSNTNPHTTQIPLNLDPASSNKYLIGMDIYFTDSWKGLGLAGNNSGLNGFSAGTWGNSSSLISMKWLTLYDGKGTKHWETRAREVPDGCCIPTGWNQVTDVGGVDLRVYNAIKYTPTNTPATSHYSTNAAAQPIDLVGGWRIFAGKRMRVWWFIETNIETEAFSNYQPTTAVVPSDSGDPAYNTVAFNYVAPPAASNVYFSTAGVYQGRTIKLDDEIVTIQTCTLTGTPRTCTVNRGQHGTSVASHAIGTQVQLSWDYISLYMADVDRDPQLIYDRVGSPLPVGTSYTATQKNAIAGMWMEFGSSTSSIIARRYLNSFENLVAYVGDMFVLKEAGTGGAGGGTIPAGWASLLVKPVP